MLIMGEIPFNYLELCNEGIENKVAMKHAAKAHVTAVREMSRTGAESGWGFLGPHTPQKAGLHISSCNIWLLASADNIDIYFSPTCTSKSVIAIKTQSFKKSNLTSHMQL